MNYKQFFVYKDNDKSTDFTLKDYDYVLQQSENGKFEEDFYYIVFLRKLLFDIDILELDDFLAYQYDFNDNPSKFIKLLDRKVVPKIKTLIDNAALNLLGGDGGKTKQLVDGFEQTDDGRVTRHEFSLSLMFHQVDAMNLQNDFAKRLDLVQEFVKSYEKTLNSEYRLVWTGKNSHLTFILKHLSDLGYIEMPKHKNDDINITSFCRQIKNVFITKDIYKIDTHRHYASQGDDKYEKLRENFTSNGFEIPSKLSLG